MPNVRRIASVCLLSAAALAAGAVPSTADLSSRYQAGRQRAQQLRSQIAAQTERIQGFEGSITSLEGRLRQVQASVDTQQQLLSSVTAQLAQARARLVTLRATYTRDLAALAAELRAEYESPPPTLMNVVVDAGGFNQLVNGIRDLSTIERSNVETAKAVAAARAAVHAQTIRLAGVQAQRRRATAAVVVERDDIAQLRLSIIDRELATERSRGRAAAQLTTLHRTLVHEAAAPRRRGGAGADAVGGRAVAPPGGCVDTPFVPHGGEYGFFPAPGTNYTVDEEPVIAARLDQLGRALQLHLIGISGYRTPEHSVEVGGFADDPTPVVRRRTRPASRACRNPRCEEFCLERPFPGPREADHIQELGSPL